jgi:hypothetical protein
VACCARAWCAPRCVRQPVTRNDRQAAPTKLGKSAKVKESPYFVLMQQRGKRPPGIWLRKGAGEKRTAEPVVIYVSESSYQKRLDFYGKAQGMVDDLMEKNFEIELKKAIDSAK